MTDCTHSLSTSRRRLARRLAVLACCAAATVAATAADAWADGDPASDVLASQPLFVPADGGFPIARQTQLSRLLSSAQQDGYRIRVALIATSADLGSVGTLWRRPQDYATFLASELSLIYHGTLLVVMPDGFGVAGVGGSPAPGQSATSLTAPRAGSSMVTAAVAAVRELAAAAGHRLAVPAPGPAPAAAGNGISPDPGSWLALALGVLVIAGAWGASTRARPPARPRRVR